MERLKNWGSQKKEILIFWMQEIPLLGASQKLEFKKKELKLFECRKSQCLEFLKIRVPKKKEL